MMISENEKEKKIDSFKVNIADKLESLLDQEYKTIDVISEKE